MLSQLMRDCSSACKGWLEEEPEWSPLADLLLGKKDLKLRPPEYVEVLEVYKGVPICKWPRPYFKKTSRLPWM